jgi:hypothetical protein
MSETNPQAERQKVYDYCRTMLADGMIDVELDPIHFETALEKTINRFRQRSPNAVEESYMFLELERDKNEYRLPDEVIAVQSVFRRTLGSRSGGGTGTNFEPFNLAYMVSRTIFHRPSICIRSSRLRCVDWMLSDS